MGVYGAFVDEASDYVSFNFGEHPFEYKLPGGITLNHSRFWEMANEEMQRIDEWINKQHSADYFFNSNSI